MVPKLQRLLGSFKVTVVSFSFAIVLVFLGTLAQVHLGIHRAQQKYFDTWWVYWHPPQGDWGIPIFPGGYLLGAVLLLNLVAAYSVASRWTVKKLGILVTHLGILLLLVGGLMTSLLSVESQMQIHEGESKNYSEDFRRTELVFVDPSPKDFDSVVSIPEEILRRSGSIQTSHLPFRLEIRGYFPNARLAMREEGKILAGEQANQGLGRRVEVVEAPLVTKENEIDQVSALIEVHTPEGSMGTWLFSLALGRAQEISYQGKTWWVELRPFRYYKPYSLALLDFAHDKYVGTEIPMNFSSRLRLVHPERGEDREVLIYMNHPLRYEGETFYQASFANQDRTSILQVVRNPSWLTPYVACVLVSLGLLIHFGAQLIRFVRSPRPMSDRPPGLSETSLNRQGEGRRLPVGRWSWQRICALVSVVIVLGWLAGSMRLERVQGGFNLVEWGRLPVVAGGRLKPLDTVARTSLMALSGRQSLTLSQPQKRTLSAIEWLADVLMKPEVADGYPVFRIDHPEVRGLLGIVDDKVKRVGYDQLKERLEEIDQQAKLAQSLENANRNLFQSSIVKLYRQIDLYQRLKNTYRLEDMPEGLQELDMLEKTLTEGHISNAQTRTHLLELFETRYQVFAERSAFLFVPQEGESISYKDMQSLGQALLESLKRGSIPSGARTFLVMGDHYRSGNAEGFARAVRELRARWERTSGGEMLGRTDFEFRFNAFQPFYKSMTLYVLIFLGVALAWLIRSEGVRSVVWVWLLIAFVVHSFGLLARMWIQGRPPVTNLYSSSIFVGWGCVGLGILLERMNRDGMGAMVSSVLGFLTLLIAHHLSLDGDTMEMLRAVLDTNYWLATHVVVVTLGYASTFLAGFLGWIYILRGFFVKSPEVTSTQALEKMIYGVICFSTLFSFVGTVLGGIWADQSWGRFWGWDPKENGALMLVLWNVMILHARLGGLIRQRGLIVMAVLGNIVVSFSWFGVNMLGVGLHSYGWIDQAFFWLALFIASQLVGGLAGCFLRGNESPIPSTKRP